MQICTVYLIFSTIFHICTTNFIHNNGSMQVNKIGFGFSVLN
jgi:hypothetical protein